MAKRMNRGRSSESCARSRRSRGRQVRYCAVAALPGMRFRARPGTNAQFSCTRHETTEMMTISRGFCGDAGAPKPTAARVFPPTPIVLTMSVARWARSAPSASHARASAFPSPRTGHRLMEIVSSRPRESPHDRGQAAARASRAGLHASIIRPGSRASTTSLEPQASDRTDPLVRSRTHYACRRNKLAIQPSRRR